MDELYRSYLSLLETLRRNVAELAELANQKLEAVEKDDLMALDGVLKREQALSLSFRGLELNKEKLLGQLGLEGVPLGQLPARYPAQLREEAQTAVSALQEAYQTYQERAKAARTTLEHNLYEVENIITSLGGPKAPAESGPGYSAEETQPPESRKTDFRA